MLSVSIFSNLKLVKMENGKMAILPEKSIDKSFLKNKKKGFGSSDASDILHYAATGIINNSLRRRISEIKGEIERKEIFSKYFDLGNKVESDVFDYLKGDKEWKGIKSNPTNSLPENTFVNFTAYCHIDFESDNFFVELKATKDDVATTTKKYQGQIAWHCLIMDELEKEQSFQFAHYDTKDIYTTPELYEFDESKLTFHPVSNFADTQRAIYHGLQKLDTEWETIEPYEEKETIYMSESETREVAAMKALEDALLMEKQAALIKSKIRTGLLDNMMQRGIKTISTPYFTITAKESYVRSSVDTKKVKEFVGAEYENLTKQTTVKPSLQIKLKS